MDNLVRVEKERKYIRDELKEYKKILKLMPKGRLECHKVKPYGRQRTETYRWFWVQNKKKTYIKKANVTMAEELAYKRELVGIIGRMENRLIAIDAYLGIAKGSGSRYATKRTNEKAAKNRDIRHNRENAEVARLAYNYRRRLDEEGYLWANEDYDDGYRAEGRTITTRRGLKVRSRIEAVIADALDDHKIYYRYENKTYINGAWYHPDFMIYCPATKEYVIWEHLGMLGDEGYRAENRDKLYDYFCEGYYPNVNLILTSERVKNEIDLTLIEAIIEQFFE